MAESIEKSVAIKSAWMILEGLGFDRARNSDLERTVSAVFDTAPAADVVDVATTSWEDIERIGFASFEATCQHCKRRMMYRAWWKYCPQCGAKVEEDNG